MIKKIKSIPWIYKILRSCILFYYRKNLNKLAYYYSTDKNNGHFYTQHYQKHFAPFRKKRINVLEIGVGGYENPERGGESLRMWKRYFSNAKIYSMDIFDKSKIQEKRIRIFQGSQIDKSLLSSMLAEIGELEIIIDDGSHVNDHVIKTFEFLFPKLAKGGLYVVEDTQTSYWPEYGGKKDNSSETIMNYFKNKADCLNSQEFNVPDYKRSYFDETIISMHFYHNLIFIYKGLNNEPSNLLA